MDNKTIIVGLAVALLVAAGFWVLRPERVVYQNTGEPLGALAGPDIPSPYLRWGDVSTWQYSMSMVTNSYNGASGSTTPCAIQSPAATSSLVWFGLDIQIATGTAADLSLAKSATPYATTTPFLTNLDLAAGADLSLVYDSASSTASTTLPQGRLLFAPNQYLVLGAKGAGGPRDRAGHQFGGICKAVFRAVAP